ncbi:helix-turn-helix domain-containing protein [Catenuloplanes atrovinosus]|uniref:Plasmid maintenance system antidote protein VapI n=1 Tax=Catenuloplanes atrovinosus TaxID=137266 RepID=A0AAE3YK54_9ACTN|nr:helix-turn-helix transcriptional regulator [Catenuloplanes atrovinosus]MDR7273879.1 plasmid maintenance system antidote protein VapI [Catenuloplanes atrovinosus]
MRNPFRSESSRIGDPAAGDLGRLVVDEVTWYMRENKVTRGELAQAMGVSPGRVSQILSGEENLTLRTLCSVVEALGAQVEFALRPVDEALT